MTDKSQNTFIATTASVTYEFRTLEPTDGMALHRLVRECPPLDTNSLYCNLLQCSHFKTTSIAVVSNDDLVGSVTGYHVPNQPDTVFVWQVAVHPTARGKGLARTMLRKLLERMAPQGIRFIETSITLSNEASLKLFARFATEQHANMVRSVMFEQESHFEGVHETEHLFRIGPFDNATHSPAPI